MRKAATLAPFSSPPDGADEAIFLASIVRRARDSRALIAEEGAIVQSKWPSHIIASHFNVMNTPRITGRSRQLRTYFLAASDYIYYHDITGLNRLDSARLDDAGQIEKPSK